MKYSFRTASVVSSITLLAALLLVACIDSGDTADSGIPGNTIKQGSWTSMAHPVQGSWYIVQNGAKMQVFLGKDFSTINGPDLHLFLSPQEPSAITGKTATQGRKEISDFPGGSGNLKGPITVDIPEGTDLSQYKSIVIHCVQYSTTWAVGAL